MGHKENSHEKVSQSPTHVCAHICRHTCTHTHTPRTHGHQVVVVNVICTVIKKLQ